MNLALGGIGVMMAALLWQAGASEWVVTLNAVVAGFNIFVAGLSRA